MAYEIPQKLFEAIDKRNLALFVGSGVSRQASSHFPSWRDLILSLSRTATEESPGLPDDFHENISQLLNRGEYLMAAEHVKQQMPLDLYESCLRDIFAARVTPGEIHRQIMRLAPAIVVSTNYDRLLEDAYAEQFRRAPVAYTYQDAAAMQRTLLDRDSEEAPVFFKIHGDIEKFSSIVLTERDYRTLLHDSAGYRLVLSALLLTHVVLFLGFSFDDQELRLTLAHHRHALKSQTDPDYIALSEGLPSAEMSRFREDYGLRVVTYDNANNHRDLYRIVTELADYSQGLTD